MLAFGGWCLWVGLVLVGEGGGGLAVEEDFVWCGVTDLVEVVGVEPAPVQRESRGAHDLEIVGGWGAAAAGLGWGFTE